MGADWPAEADESPEGAPNPRGGGSGHGDQAAPAEGRSREEYANRRRAVSNEHCAEDGAQAEKWEKDAAESRWMWGEYQRRWPPEERSPVDSSADPPGSWRAHGNKFLDRANNARVEAACDRIADRERTKISPAMRQVESQDADRHLVGFDNRLKGRDRIKDKVCRSIKNFGRSPEQAISRVPDTVRYTFQYQEERYVQGVTADVVRLREQGFELSKLRNAWSGDQYKGINSQWVEPDSGQRFEVQFHTRVSFEAKQLTHGAYERLRTRQPDKFEQMVLEAFQKKVAADVPVPRDATRIPDYPERGSHA
ncbi:MAG: hypothetical protein ABSB59_18440 [Streptosporangiaceae bacterium]